MLESSKQEGSAKPALAIYIANPARIASYAHATEIQMIS